MESMQAHTIQYIRTKDNRYYDEKKKEQNLQKHFDSIQVDDTLEISQRLEESIKEYLEQKQEEQDEWVNLSDYWQKVTDSKDWENTKSKKDSKKTCIMSVVRRKRDALKHFKQRALKKAKKLGIEYEMRYVKSKSRWGTECYMNRKDMFVRRKYLSLFFTTNKKGKFTYAVVKRLQAKVIKEFGVNKHIRQSLLQHKIEYGTFINRICKGWSLQKAISTPPRNTNNDRFLQKYPHRAWEVKCPVKKTNKEILAEYEGKTFYRRRATLQDLLKENGITEKQFCIRIRNGWSFASATTLDKGGFTEQARKRHNKRDIAKHVRQSRAKRYMGR